MMNMTKIAKLAGCSLSTVSKAFRDSPEISPETKEKIFQIAKDGGCFLKFYSPIYEKKVIAVICKELIDSSYGVMVESLNQKISKKGDTLLISSSNFAEAALESLVDYYVNYHRVDGILLVDSMVKDKALFGSVPFVLLSTSDKKPSYVCDRVFTDRSHGIYQAVSHMQALGHRSIGFIGEYLTGHTFAYFQSAMKTCGLELNEEWLFTSSKRKAEAGYDGADQLLSRASRPTAVFTAYDAIAFGAINCFHAAGLRIPEDISIVSYNDIPLAQFSTPPLSTIASPVEDLTESALSLLYRRMANPSAPHQTVSVHTNLVIRESVKKIR